MKRFLAAMLTVAIAGCSRAHIRNYDLPKEALVMIQDEHQIQHPLEPGGDFIAASDKDAVLVIEDIRQTRYPLRKGWRVSRDLDCVTIEEIPSFKPY